jgi:hypothetical protein
MPSTTNLGAAVDDNGESTQPGGSRNPQVARQLADLPDSATVVYFLLSDHRPPAEEIDWAALPTDWMPQGLDALMSAGLLEERDGDWVLTC